jgi:hypothetical protein
MFRKGSLGRETHANETTLCGRAFHNFPELESDSESLNDVSKISETPSAFYFNEFDVEHSDESIIDSLFVTLPKPAGTFSGDPKT